MRRRVERNICGRTNKGYLLICLDIALRAKGLVISYALWRGYPRCNASALEGGQHCLRWCSKQDFKQTQGEHASTACLAVKRINGRAILNGFYWQLPGSPQRNINRGCTSLGCFPQQKKLCFFFIGHTGP